MKMAEAGERDRTLKSLIGNQQGGGGGVGERGYTLGENCTEYLNPTLTIQHLNIIPRGRCA